MKGFEFGEKSHSDMSISERNSQDFKDAANELLTIIQNRFNVKGQDFDPQERKEFIQGLVTDNDKFDSKHLSYLIEKGFINASDETEYELTPSVETRKNKVAIREYYSTEADFVELKSKVFSPELSAEEHEANKGKASIFLSGYTATPDNGTMQDLNKYFAEFGKADLHCISTRLEQTEVQGSLAHQAEAIAKYIHDQGLKEVNLIGYSNGGAKSFETARILKDKYPDTKVNGLVTGNPVGVYDQSAADVEANFFKTIFQLRPSLAALKGSAEVAYGALRELYLGGLKGYATRKNFDAVQMGTANASLKDIDVHFGLVAGIHDHVTNIKKMAPDINAEDKKALEEYFQEHIVPNSKSVSIEVIHDTYAHHGFPDEIPEEFARKVFDMFKQFKEADELEKARAAVA